MSNLSHVFLKQSILQTPLTFWRCAVDVDGAIKGVGSMVTGRLKFFSSTPARAARAVGSNPGRPQIIILLLKPMLPRHHVSKTRDPVISSPNTPALKPRTRTSVP